MRDDRSMSTDLPETCDECVFDGSRWTNQDATRTLAHAGDLVGGAVARLPPGHDRQRPDPGTWSIVEYVDHLREVIFANHFLCASAQDQPGIELGGPPPAPMAADVPDIDLGEAIERLDAEGASFASFLTGLDKENWHKAATVGGENWDSEWCARHACHDLFHHLTDIARIRTRIGDSAGPLAGSVASLHASHGGVPKHTIAEAAIDLSGVVGDRQASRVHHGRPWQALCLYSADIVDALAAEGHPIAPGAAGENISVRGFDWSALRAGLVVEIGDVRCRLSAPAVPCSKNSQWFSDGDPQRISHDLHPGWSRWYAGVLSPGIIHQGDGIRIFSD